MRVAFALFAGVATAAALPPLVAVAVSSPPIHLSVGTTGTGTLSARGAAVTVPMYYNCPTSPQQPAYLYLEVAENVKGKIANANNSVSVKCTGKREIVDVYLQASNHALAPGSASAQFSIDNYSKAYGYTYLSGHSSITLKDPKK
jgi:hypothetical protein